MALTYRTDDGAKWGTGKGGNLTAAEVDGNFWELAQQIAALGAGPAPAEIDTITVVGTQMTITLDDGRVFGPFTLPRAAFRWRGQWAASTSYAGNDVFEVPGEGVYLSRVAHTSPASWDADHQAGDPLDDAYQLMMGAVLGGVETVAATTFTPATGADWTYHRCTDASGCAVTVPTDAAESFAVGDEIRFTQRGAAAVTVAGDTGVTVNVPTGFTASTGHVGAVLTIKKVAANEWDLFGDLATV